MTVALIGVQTTNFSFFVIYLSYFDLPEVSIRHILSTG